MNKLKKLKKEKNKLITESEVESKLDILVKGQINNSQELEAIRNDLQRGFIGLALWNEKLNQKLEIAVSELNAMKKEREEKAARREKWAKRKRLPKRDPINSEIYTLTLLIKESEGPTYIATRTRIAICLLTVTGIRIGELLSLKVG